MTRIAKAENLFTEQVKKDKEIGDLQRNLLKNVKTPSAQVTRATTVAIPDNAQTVVTWTVENWDTHDMWTSSGSSATRLTVPTGWQGIYEIFANVPWATLVGSPQIIYVFIRKNGSTILGQTTGEINFAASGGPVLQVRAIDNLAVGDYVELVVYQDNSSGVTNDIIVFASIKPIFTLQYIRPPP